MIIHFRWLQNPEPDIAGYKLYSRRVVTQGYAIPIDMGNALNGTYDLGNIEGVWRFALTAYNTAGLESDFSAELSREFIVPSRVRIVRTYP